MPTPAPSRSPALPAGLRAARRPGRTDVSGRTRPVPVPTSPAPARPSRTTGRALTRRRTQWSSM